MRLNVNLPGPFSTGTNVTGKGCLGQIGLILFMVLLVCGGCIGLSFVLNLIDGTV